MKVLLIRPRPDSQSIGLQSFMICEPLELEYAAVELSGAELLLRGLSTRARVVLFDKRGTGLSDRSSQIFTLEQRMSDVQATPDVLASIRIPPSTGPTGCAGSKTTETPFDVPMGTRRLSRPADSI